MTCYESRLPIVTDVSEHVSIFKFQQKEALICSETSVIIYRSTGYNVSDYCLRQYCCKTRKSGLNITLLNGINTRT
jgi:hypothetical protein